MTEKGQMYRVVFPDASFESRLTAFLRKRQEKVGGCCAHDWSSRHYGHFFDLSNDKRVKCLSIDMIAEAKNLRHPYYHATVAVCDEQTAAMEWYCKIMGVQYQKLPLLKR